MMNRNLGKIIGLVVLVAVLIGAFFYLRAGDFSFFGAPAEDNAAAVAAAVEKETADLVAKVGRHMILPTDETPQVAEISDATLAAKEQPFYAGAQNGDRLLVYLNLRKAIIYSPARDLIVNVGPIYMEEDGTAQPAPAPEEE